MTSLGLGATDLMVQYARYHRDRRNIATHFVGIPLIVFGVSALLARPEFAVLGFWMSPIVVLWALTTMWYLTRGNLVLGAITALCNGLLMLAALHVSDGAGWGAWLAWGAGAFALGWLIQFIGHYYEGRKPAFVDDLVGLLVGPMFLVGEALFALGLSKRLASDIERAAGPTYLRNLHPGPSAPTR
jgi:uncharacterized membrane protein YGL010W